MERFDVIVIGAGHAGCEAALAAARMGCRTLLLTMSLDTVAQMSCNPCIGGTAKGIVVREVDALGGWMALAADASGIQFRMLNSSRGPAVRSPRAQCDRRLYSMVTRHMLETASNLVLRQEIADTLLLEPADRRAGKEPAADAAAAGSPASGPVTGCGIGRGGGASEPPAAPPARSRVVGVVGYAGVEYEAKAVVVTTGTFLRGLIHIGDRRMSGGRNGEPASEGLSESLAAAGLAIGRLKTGTPPRINARTVDLDALPKQWGDDPPRPFSYRTKELNRPNIPCYITRTTEKTHDIIQRNLDRAPLFTGQIKAPGPRYCPSVELKVVRFPDRTSHSVFLEPEGERTGELYVNGLSTSLPAEVQVEMVRSLPGCESAEITRFGYAIEYDFVPSHQIGRSLMAKAVAGLFLAGQINGTSGYEEAAGQGIIAGINAALYARGEPPLILGRDQAYIGVMIDDLCSKEIDEPYRLFTSRAEYRLMLRQDNADERLMPLAEKLGLLPADVASKPGRRREVVERAARALREVRRDGVALIDLLRRPEVTFESLRRSGPLPEEAASLSHDQAELLEIEVKYEGYLKRHAEQIERMKRIEDRRIPPEIEYEEIEGLSREAAEKLSRYRPETFGQASRLAGVTPADLALLAVHIESRHRRGGTGIGGAMGGGGEGAHKH
ncbi:MAG: tRNA uridine-5-carboxymethylaminomethyl(34) synthesis enzyme MnmG [Planctomycetota bacterium]|nr:tRNA uridine-5-carboxymethylaminomethyl(34) synthesis enzyme MnmG [Planctomycetota bacterium]